MNVIDECKAKSIADHAREACIAAENPDRLGDRIGRGEAAVGVEFVQIRAVEFRDDLGKIEFASALSFEFLRSDAQRVAVDVFGRKE